jgi:hypothetical protein
MFLHSHPTTPSCAFQQDPMPGCWAHSGRGRRRYARCCAAIPGSHDRRSSPHTPQRQGVAGLARGIPRISRSLVVGTDTFTPGHWHYVIEHARWSRAPRRPAAQARAQDHFETRSIVRRRPVRLSATSIVVRLCVCECCGRTVHSIWDAEPAGWCSPITIWSPFARPMPIEVGQPFSLLFNVY